ncbi:TPA: DUF4209 domain-containing protein [Citrobacter gillenii]
MNQLHYPEERPITAQDFAECGWRNVIDRIDIVNNRTLWRAFSDSAQQALEHNMATHSKVLWLLADACSMVLNPSSVNQPFTFATALNGRRSAISDDFSDADIDFFANIINEIDHIWLKARLADLIWYKQRRRGVSYALMAIDGYRAMPLDRDAWLQGVGLCRERGIRLARQLGVGAGNRLNEMVEEIQEVLLGTTINDGFHGLQLSKLIEAAGVEENISITVAQKLENLSTELLNRDNFNAQRKFSIAASEWFERIGNKKKVAEITAQIAESWVSEGESRTIGASPSHMVAASFYENAIQVYRSIPRAYRNTYRVEEKMTELRRRLSEHGERALLEMSTISSPGVDISDSIADARRLVSGKEMPEALLSLANLYQGVNALQLQADAAERLAQTPFLALISSTMVSNDGRVIARRPGMSLDDNSSTGDEVRIRAEMVISYGLLLRLIVQGRILPALDILLLEHVIQEDDFIDLARQSPIVPKERAVLFGKALYAGYNRDFVTALHLLVPQIEHLVRIHLKQAGAITTNLDQNGIENENGLSTLLDLPETEAVFGQDLKFELKSLFCDPLGPNLRNELAHGLLDDDGCRSLDVVYTWWLSLRLVFNTWWNRSRLPENPPQSESSGD